MMKDMAGIRPVVVDEARCTGCGLCVDMCSAGALALVDGCVAVVRPEACALERGRCPFGGPEDCGSAGRSGTGTCCTGCEAICPYGALGEWIWRPVFIADLCNGCELCIEMCHPRGLQVVDGAVQLVEPEACLACYECEDICPTGAVHLEPVRRDSQPAAVPVGH